MGIRFRCDPLSLYRPAATVDARDKEKFGYHPYSFVCAFAYSRSTHLGNCRSKQVRNLFTSPVRPLTLLLYRCQVRTHLNGHLFVPVTATVYKAIDTYSHGVKTFLWHECNQELDRYDFSTTELFFNEVTLPSLEEVFTYYRDRKDRESAKWTRGYNTFRSAPILIKKSLISCVVQCVLYSRRQQRE